MAVENGESPENIPDHIAAEAEKPRTTAALIEFAYQRLKDEGVRPDYARVRAKIAKLRPDGRGPSYSTIVPIVKALLKKERVAVLVLAKIDPPGAANLTPPISEKPAPPSAGLIDPPCTGGNL